MKIQVRTTQYLIAATALVGVQIGVLCWLGQPFFSETGKLLFWVNDPFSPETSQQFSDWYSFSHIVHGFIFFGVLWWAVRRWSLGLRLLFAMTVEITWEIFENTPMVIEAYRQQALAVGYVGDSIFNSVCDTGMMVLGFYLAAKLPWRITLALAIVIEVFVAIMIRDNLTLNVLNFAVPLQFIHDWQAGVLR